jgi:CO/xanthine dehydrogenase FAD-binding subunit
VPSNKSRLDVYYPHSVQEALHVLADSAEALLFNGGTLLVNKIEPLWPPAGPVINVSSIPDLQRLSRSETFLDIGAACTLNKTINTGSAFLPPVFLKAVRSIGNPLLRNQASVGGNLLFSRFRLDIYPILVLLDSRLEIRSMKKTRWIETIRLFQDDKSDLQRGKEILCRIRIPLKDWNYQHYYKFNSPFSPAQDGFSFCVLATIRDSVISEIRFGMFFYEKGLVRIRATEASLVGRRVPLSGRDQDSLRIWARADLIAQRLNPVVQSKCLQIFTWLLMNLKQPEPTEKFS